MDNPPSDGNFSGEVHSVDPPILEPALAEPKKFSPPVIESALPQRPGVLICALGGLQAGVVGVIWMFLCFFVAAFWGGGGTWSVPNLLATYFYGENAFQNEFYRTTWAGIALIVVLYGLIGILWGSFWRERRRPLLSFYGVMLGVGTYFLFFDFVWEHVSPTISLFAPVRPLVVAHMLWGAALAKSPAYATRIAAALRSTPVSGGGAPSSGQSASSQDAAEIVSGQVIR